jgi:HD-GYP domain-containing protein (c-di-GMP phosphodiesterase class II)
MTESQRYDEHYLRDVAALGDQRDLRTRDEVWSSTGIKLLAKDVKVDSRLLDRLMAHKLKPPIEQSLTVEQPVSSSQLRAEASTALGAANGHGLLSNAAARPTDLLEAIERAPIDESLALRLTVMRERRADMYAHAVGVALLAAAIARRAGMVGGELARIAGAGLYHDIGEMHIDPELLTTKRHLTDAERRHFYAHPLTAYLLLEQSAAGQGALAEAVLEHHERLDGSGYPRGLRGEEMSRGGRILALAELATGFFAKPVADGALRRLAVVLKLNHRRFDRELAGHVIWLSQQAGAAPEAATDESVQAALLRVDAIQDLFKDWHGIVEGGLELGPAAKWLAGQMSNLERTLAEAGLDILRGPEHAALLADDPEARAELPAAVRELSWLLGEIQRNLYQRADAPTQGPVFEWSRKLSPGAP